MALPTQVRILLPPLQVVACLRFSREAALGSGLLPRMESRSWNGAAREELGLGGRDTRRRRVAYPGPNGDLRRTDAPSRRREARSRSRAFDCDHGDAGRSVKDALPNALIVRGVGLGLVRTRVDAPAPRPAYRHPLKFNDAAPCRDDTVGHGEVTLALGRGAAEELDVGARLHEPRTGALQACREGTIFWRAPGGTGRDARATVVRPAGGKSESCGNCKKCYALIQHARERYRPGADA